MWVSKPGRVPPWGTEVNDSQVLRLAQPEDSALVAYFLHRESSTKALLTIILLGLFGWASSRGRRRGDKWREKHGSIYTTICKTDSQRKFAV